MMKRFVHHAEVTFGGSRWKSPRRGIVFIMLVFALIDLRKQYFFALNFLFEFPEKFAFREDDSFHVDSLIFVISIISLL